MVFLNNIKTDEIIVEQAKIPYSPLEKAFEKQNKTIEDSRAKQVK